MMKANKKILIGIGLLGALVVAFGLFYIIAWSLNPIIPTDTKIIKILEENEESLLSIEGVVGAGIARDENNHIIGIAVYVVNTSTIQAIPKKLGEFKVFVKNVSETTEAERRMIISRFHHPYPADVKGVIFDDSEKIKDTSSFFIQTYKPLNTNEVQSLRNSGVRLLQYSEIPNVYPSLIEEDKVDDVENLDFVKAVYPYPTKQNEGDN